MDLTPATNPEPDDTTELEVAQADLQDATEGDDEQPETEVPPPEEELEETEYAGKKYRLPKDIIPALMLQSDYTRKTQEVADTRRELEAQQTAFRQEQAAQQEFVADIGQLAAIDHRIRSFDTVDWQALNASNPQEAQRLYFEFNQLRDARREHASAIEQKMAQRHDEMERQRATHLSKAVAELSKPDAKFGWAGKFDDSAKQTLTNFGLQIGYSNEELANTTHPLMIKTLHLARIGHEFLQKQKATATKPAVEATPVPKVGGAKATASKDPEKMSADEWVKWREQQLRNKR